METLDSLKSGLASGRLAGATSIKLCDGLREFPSELFALADSLTFLNLSNNQLTELPAEFDRFRQLEIAFFNNNRFEQFPTVLARCPKLSMVSFKNNAIAHIEPDSLSSQIRWLILTNNNLTSLPASIGNLHKLQKCMLAGNGLTEVPKALLNCERLELIRLSANRLEALPNWLLTLPRLAWIAYAGNPCSPQSCFLQACSPQGVFQDALHSSAEKLQEISANEITFGEVLGEGASGIIYKGTWNKGTWNQGIRSATEQTKTVAIKLFKGEITSDGSPIDEMRACIAAGSHPNLVTVLGRYQEEGKTGLVFTFIPPNYKNLGGPPSLDSCTRDVYDAEVSFSFEQILKIAGGVASVEAHLHRRGIMHGDLYAHNILIDEQGHSILGDFGAASFYEVETDNHALERLEVRAFGCLLEDLLGRCADKPVGDAVSFEVLEKLRESCMQSAVERRPLFDSICSCLADLK